MSVNAPQTVGGGGKGHRQKESHDDFNQLREGNTKLYLNLWPEQTAQTAT